MKNHRYRRQAFSLMELLAVVTILGIIAAIIVPRVTTSSDTAKAKVHAHNRGTINSAIERYYIENGSWPSADLNELDVVTYFPDGIPTNPVDNSAYAMNATTHRID
ncbi:Type II secretion system protein G precursor [Botrimarina colliarenosi]|uniref:Type II secretion system protein G n=1 Tax=Botrimarina colliarenosi TaxID=2528001 RepID=A0A5C6AI09_9BACT|nr:prepilin-type N-terminal cleavage/methylation domain-containing protein [Botrimarina colliarenosi]TWT97873.1 Type II secretion system protein G precursor [Botrimarina colliarenosi]